MWIVADGFLWQAAGPLRGRPCFTSSVDSCSCLLHWRRRCDFRAGSDHSRDL